MPTLMCKAGNKMTTATTNQAPTIAPMKVPMSAQVKRPAG